MKEEVTIYHNPRCSKSRASLELITSMGVTPKVKLYLEEKILHEELDEILKMLKIKPHDLLRKSEKEYKEFNLGNNELKDEDIWLLLPSYKKAYLNTKTYNNKK